MPDITIPEELFSQILKKLSEILRESQESLTHYSKRQLELLSQKAIWLASSRATGDLKNNDKLFEHFEDNLKESAHNFAKTIALHTIATLQKAWNAIVGTLWDAMDMILGKVGISPLVRPALESTPVDA